MGALSGVRKAWAGFAQVRACGEGKGSDARAWWLAGLALTLFYLLTFGEALLGLASVDASSYVPRGDLAFAPQKHPPVAVSPQDASPGTMGQLWDHWAMGELRAGRLPLWYPDSGFGHPLLANGQAAPLSPWKALLIWGPEGPGQAWFLASRPLVGAWGALLLGRAWSLGLWPSLLLALAFSANGFFLHHFRYPEVHGLVMMPWLALATWALVQRPGPRRAACLAAGVGFTGLLGHAEGALYAASAGVVAGCAAGGLRQRRAWPWLIVALAWGAGLAAVAVWPFLAWVGQSQSYLQARDGSVFSDQMHHWTWWRALVSSLRHALGPLAWPDPSNYNAWATTAALALAPWAMRLGTPATRAAAALLAYWVASVLLFPPTGLWPLPYLPNSFYALPTLALAVGLWGAQSLAHWVEQGLPNRKLWASWLLALGLVAGGLEFWQQHQAQRRGQSPPGGHGGALLNVGALGLASFAGPWAAPLVVGGAALEAWWAYRLSAPPLPRWPYPAPDLAQSLPPGLGGGRVAGEPGCLTPNLGQAQGWRHASLVEAWIPTRYLAYWKAMCHEGSLSTNYRLLPGFDRDLARLAGISCVVTPTGGALARDLMARPQGYRLAAQGAKSQAFVAEVPPEFELMSAWLCLPKDGDAAAERLMASPGLWRGLALVEGPAPVGWNPTTRVPPVPVVVGDAKDQGLLVRFNASRPSLLVRRAQWVEGWEALLDEREALPIHPTWVAFQGVFVPPGQHTLRFSYRPPSVLKGGILSAFSLLLMLGVILWRRRPSGRQTGVGQDA